MRVQVNGSAPSFSHTSGFLTCTVLIVVPATALDMTFRHKGWL